MPEPARDIAAGSAGAPILDVKGLTRRFGEAAGSADREAIYKAIGLVQIPFGDKYLYLSRPDGLSFGQDRMPLDATSMMVQWTADQKHQVVWPSQYAEAKPRF